MWYITDQFSQIYWLQSKKGLYTQPSLIQIMESKKLIERVLFAIALFSFFGGVYICGNALFHPETLSIQLTHLTPWIREDTFGILCWLTSFISFTIWNIIRK
jgi:hypothetical protein